MTLPKSPKDIKQKNPINSLKSFSEETFSFIILLDIACRFMTCRSLGLECKIAVDRYLLGSMHSCGNVDNVYELIKVCYHILSSCNHRHVIQLCQIIILDQLMTRIIYFS